MEILVVTRNSVYVVRGSEVIDRATFEDSNRYFLSGRIINPEQLVVGGTLFIDHDGGKTAMTTPITAIIKR